MQPQNYEFFTNHIFPLVFRRRNWQLEMKLEKLYQFPALLSLYWFHNYKHKENKTCKWDLILLHSQALLPGA